MAYSLTYPNLTPDFLKLAKGVFDKVPDMGKDTELESVETIIASCIKAAENFCNQPLLQQSNTYYFFNPIDNESNRLLPYSVPVTVTAVHSRITAFDTWETVSTDNYRVEAIGRFTRLHHKEFTKDSTYRVTSTVGYTEANFESSLQQIILDMAYDYFEKYRDHRFGLQSKAINGAGTNATITYKDMSAEFRQRLNRFRIGVV